MDIPKVNSLESLVLASVSNDDVMSRFLALPPVKSLQFVFAVTLIIGSSNGNKLKADENFGTLTPVYLLWGETSSHHKLKKRHTKSVKDDDSEVETGIWYDVKAGVMG